MSQTRRDFIKTNAALAAAAAAGLSLPGVKQAEAADDGIRWDKGVCRFCGTGCGELVGVKDGRVVAMQGDPDAPVNRGLNCIKGYFLAKIMYGKDRLTKPLLRKRNGVYDKDGDFEEVSWDEAFDIMAEKWKEALKAKGPTSVGMFGSGQWTIWEGYAGAKLMKAGFRSNNIDPNARHCMASAVVGFIRAFGIDEPMGCYDDLEHADTFVLWGANMAEMHPILWSRLTNTRLTKEGCEVHVLSTFENRCFELADNGMVFVPQTDLAILNYIANYIIENDAVNWDFVNKSVNFTKTRHRHRLRAARRAPCRRPPPIPTSARWTKITFEEYKAEVAKYTLDYTAKLSGVPKDKLVKLAQAYADPKRKVSSYWTMGFNQHSRGSWVNGLIYNVHLLVGKIAEPGNSPFSLTGQPSACGTAREVGTFAHRLPADLVVMNEGHRDAAERIWKLPKGTIPGKPGYHAVLQNRMLKDGKLNAYWVQCTNNMQAAPNMNEEGWPGYRNPENFITVSDPYPTVTALAADLILPTAMWMEKEGAYGNAERRTQFWRQQVKAPGEARSDVWQVVEFSKRFTVEEVWPEELIAQMPDYKRQDAVRRPFRQRPGRQVPARRPAGGIRQRRIPRLRLLPSEGPVRGIPDLPARGAEEGPRDGRVRALPSGPRPALAGHRRQGDPVALPRGLRPPRQGRRGRQLLRQQGQPGEHHLRPLRAGRRGTGQGVRSVAVDRAGAGALAFGLDDPAGSRAAPGLPGRRHLHASARRPATAASSAARRSRSRPGAAR